MKKQEKMSRVMERSRKRRATTRYHYSPPATSSLPHDLTLEILSKLPIKSVMRFRCVSKLWSSSITTKPYFNNLFETHSSTCPKLLVTFRADDKHFVFSISQQNLNRSVRCTYSQPMDCYHIKYRHYITSSNTGSVHGLICFVESGNPRVWNPSMRKFLTLPKPRVESNYIKFFLGYDPLKVTHKVICMSREKKSVFECRVLTLGSDQESWRIVRTEYNHLPLTAKGRARVYQQCIDGVLYYHAEFGNDVVIMSFDVRSEKFGMIKFPYGRNPWELRLISYEGKLACVGDSTFELNSISIWVLVDASKHEWSNHHFSPLSHSDLLESRFRLSGISDNGELIYVRVTIDHDLDIVYLDLKRKMLRRVSYKGILDDEFKQRNGFGKEETSHDFHFFPNHLETLL